MALPPLLKLPDEGAYRAHFEREYVLGASIMTFDGIPVSFHKGQFNHAFYMSKVRGGPKALFDTTRAERMGWIKWGLAEPSLEVYRRIMRGGATRRLVLEASAPYLIVCQLLPTNPQRAVFITAYVVTDATMLPKIRGNPPW